MATESSPTTPRPWIISPLCDLLFLVGTPVLAIPLVFALARGLSLLDLSLLIVVLATGHHLPTFLRTYGDRDLFSRYWLRLTVIPLALLVTQAFFLQRGWQGLGLIVLVWAPWHSAMQTYGFMRIYDAKQGQVAPATARLDWYMCLAWFLTILLWSPHFMFSFGSEVHGVALRLPAASVLIALKWLATGATIAVTAVYVARTLWLLARGRPVSRLKLTLLVTSVGTYFFAFNAAPDPVVGLASWEVFHDVQYYAIVWAYNRSLVGKGRSATRALRFLFRPRLAMVGLYLLLVGMYGVSDLAVSFLPQHQLGQIARSVFVISALLHFYYDGFIWRVRQPKTREHLDVAEKNRGAQTAAPAAAPRMQWAPELRQVAYVMAPLLLLGAIQARGDRPSQRQSLGTVAELSNRGERTVRDPGPATPQMRDALQAEQRVYRTIAELAPGGDSLHALGRSLQEAGLPEQAIAMYRNALARDPDHLAANFDLAMLLVEQGDLQAAIPHFQRGIVEHPEPTTLATFVGDRRVVFQSETRADGFRRFGNALAQLGRINEAAEKLWRAWRIAPPVLSLRQEIALDLSDVLRQQGRFAQAIDVLRQGIDQGAQGQLILVDRLARLLATCPEHSLRQPQEALRLAQLTCRATDFEQLEALETLAHCYAATGNLEQARETAIRLVRLARAQNAPKKAGQYQQLRDHFEQQQSNAPQN